MNKKIEFIIEWIKAHDFRDQCIMLLLSFAIIYVLTNFFFVWPLEKEDKELLEKMKTTKSAMNVMLQQISMIASVVNTNSYKKVTQGAMFFHGTQSVPNLTNDILSQKTEDVVLVNLKNLLDQPWSVSGDNPAATLNPVTQHSFQLNFVGNYFGVINYLTRLEQLPWHLYWDTLEYKVVKYPQAEVVVKVHILSKQQ